MTLRYSVDDGPAIETVATNFEFTDLQMVQILQEDLKDDDVQHLLTVNVTAVTNSFQLGVDFITYNATFERISDLNSVPVMTAHKTSHTGAIVGGVVGGLSFIGLVMLGLYIMRNRRARQQRTAHAASAISRHLNWRRGEYRPSH